MKRAEITFFALIMIVSAAVPLGLFGVASAAEPFTGTGTMWYNPSGSSQGYDLGKDAINSDTTGDPILPLTLMMYDSDMSFIHNVYYAGQHTSYDDVTNPPAPTDFKNSEKARNGGVYWSINYDPHYDTEPEDGVWYAKFRVTSFNDAGSDAQSNAQISFKTFPPGSSFTGGASVSEPEVNDPEPPKLPKYDSFDYVWDKDDDPVASDQSEASWNVDEDVKKSIDIRSVGLAWNETYVFLGVTFSGPPMNIGWNKMSMVYDTNADGTEDYSATVWFNTDQYPGQAVGATFSDGTTSTDISAGHYYDIAAEDGEYALNLRYDRSLLPSELGNLKWSVSSLGGDVTNNMMADFFPERATDGSPGWEKHGGMSSSESYYKVVLACSSVLEVRDESGHMIGRTLTKKTESEHGESFTWYEVSDFKNTFPAGTAFEMKYDAGSQKSYRIQSSENLQFIVHTPYDNDQYEMKVAKYSSRGVEMIKADSIKADKGQASRYSASWDGDDTTVKVDVDTNGDGTYDKTATSTTAIMSQDRVDVAKSIAVEGDLGAVLFLLPVIVGVLVAVLLLVKKGVIGGKKSPSGPPQSGGPQQWDQPQSPPVSDGNAQPPYAGPPGQTPPPPPPPQGPPQSPPPGQMPPPPPPPQ